MKTLLKLACAASALAFASAAHAQTPSSYSVTITGTVPSYCNIYSATTPSSALGTFTSDTTGAKFTLASLADDAGLVRETTVTTTLTIKANGTCTASLSSANGVLKNGTRGSVSYQASIGDTVLHDVATGDSFASSPIAYTEDFLHTLAIGVKIPGGSSAIAAGSYSDILTLKLTPAA
jgi:hypothetical protein